MECGPMRGLAAYVLAGILTALQTPGPLPKVMVGCVPAYSPLLTSARASTAGRCIT